MTKPPRISRGQVEPRFLSENQRSIAVLSVVLTPALAIVYSQRGSQGEGLVKAVIVAPQESIEGSKNPNDLQPVDVFRRSFYLLASELMRGLFLVSVVMGKYLHKELDSYMNLKKDVESLFYNTLNECICACTGRAA